ncbi:hypothetical protein P8452_12179 [Trifolium repens]|nr:hypothetical protein P8452_12179 [Trifolium repens]
MTPFSINGPIKCNNRIMSFSALPFSKTYNNCYNISLPRKLHRNVDIHAKSLCSFSCKNSIHEKLHSRKKRGFSIISFDAKNSEPIGEDNDQALDAVMKLYSAFKNKNTQELSEILADECRCVCNFLSFFKAFQGKMQVLEFFSHLIRLLGDNIQIVVKPSLHDGMNVGVHWKFEWNTIHIPLGKGFSFHICQTYRGKAVIKNIEMFMEPLLLLEPFMRLKMKTNLKEILKISSLTRSEFGNMAKRILCIVLALFAMAALLLYFMK